MIIKPLYTLTEVADALQTPLRTVQHWAKNGRLVTVQFCGRPHVPLAVLYTQGLVWDSIKLASRLNERSGNRTVPA